MSKFESYLEMDIQRLDLESTAEWCPPNGQDLTYFVG
jgi:hypothetical protein